MKVQINGKTEQVADSLTVAGLLESLKLPTESVAVEVNEDLVKRADRAARVLKEGDVVEVVRMIAGGNTTKLLGQVDTPFEFGGRAFSSRLLMGTGRYPSFDHMRRCHQASACDIVTLAVSRHDFSGAGENILDYIDRTKLTILPNTAGAFTAREAVRLARLAQELLGTDWIKLEVLSNPTTLWPDVQGTLEACRTLVKEGFKVFPYTTDDPVVAKRLEEEGAVAVMPLGSMIGSGLGVLNPVTIQLIKENAKVPVIVDAGVGCASDAALAMELGADGVLLNTAVAQAQDPMAMARAMGLAVEAGRLSYLAGRIPKRTYATPSSPGAGLANPGDHKGRPYKS